MTAELPPFAAEVLDPRDPTDAERLRILREDDAATIVDHVHAMRTELRRLRPVPGPELTEEPTRWVHYPWRRALVHVLGPAAFRHLRLDRNRNKITAEEQARFEQLRVGVIGLSVGHAIAHTLALEGLVGQLRLADFDEIELSNLNRVPASLLDLGVNKAVVAARRIAELDPYLDVVVEGRGATAATLGPLLDGLDLVIEECDSLDVKLLVREAARARRIPVLMETSDRGLLDVERFDIEPERASFHGLVEDLSSEELRGLSTRDKAPYVLRLLEPEELSSRLAASMTEIERTVTTWPQLGGDVMLGAATLAAAIRRFGREEALPSGRVRIDLDRSLDGLHPPVLDRGQEQRPPVLAPPPHDPIGLIADAANRAPSGGNVQPWRFQATADELRFHVVAERSSGMDVRSRGTLVALGAAAFNARVAAASIGQLGPIDVAGELEPGRPVVTLRLGSGCAEELAALLPAVYTRVTNRSDSEVASLDADVLARLRHHVECEGATVRWVSGSALPACAEVMAEGDRIRHLTPRLHQEMMGELRRPDVDGLETGIDLRTLQLHPADLAKVAVARRADVMAKLADWDAGHALGDATRRMVTASAALAVVTIPAGTVGDYVRGGAAFERLWLAAELQGLAVHPVSPLFLFAHDEHDVAELVEPDRRDHVWALAQRFRQLVGISGSERLAIVLRVGRAGRPTVRSGRLPLHRALTVTDGGDARRSTVDAAA